MIPKILLDSDIITIAVCSGSSCKSLGSLDIIDTFNDLIMGKRLHNNIKVSTKVTGCHGFCEQGPIVIIKPQNIFYTKVTPGDCSDIINGIEAGVPVNRLLFREAKTIDSSSVSTPIVRTHVNDIDFYKFQTRYLLRRTGDVNPYFLDDFLLSGGFQGLHNALELTPDQVVKTILDSGLRGRGGAGFLTGKKWSFLASEKADQKYVVANADEGDPGSFMDRTLMEGDPFAVIEGMIIAAYATGASKGYIYVRAEYPQAVELLRNAISICYEKNFLGKNITGKKGFSFDLELFLGAGAFVCGEETALLNSIEGKRGMPRFKPPFPAKKGLFGKPTNINNVKTYAYSSHILHEGIDSFRKYGTKDSPGTAVLSLTGSINNTGIVEVPMGTSLKDLVFKIGDGVKNGKKVKAVLTGGPSGGAIPADKLDLGVDFESLTNAGSIMGSGGVLIVDEDESMVKLSDFFIQFSMSESCGKCVPCREGTLRMHEILKKIIDGKGKESDLVLLERLANYVKSYSLCGLGQTAPNPILSTLKYFKNEYLDIIHGKQKIKYVITDHCVGCHLCSKNCPVNCIAGKPKEQHTIDQSKCIKCGACYRVCPVKAIDKVVE